MEKVGINGVSRETLNRLDKIKEAQITLDQKYQMFLLLFGLKDFSSFSFFSHIYDTLEGANAFLKNIETSKIVNLLSLCKSVGLCFDKYSAISPENKHGKDVYVAKLYILISNSRSILNDVNNSFISSGGNLDAVLAQSETMEDENLTVLLMKNYAPWLFFEMYASEMRVNQSLSKKMFLHG